VENPVHEGNPGLKHTIFKKLNVKRNFELKEMCYGNTLNF
jgi:hypothetical protein